MMPYPGVYWIKLILCLNHLELWVGVCWRFWRILGCESPIQSSNQFWTFSAFSTKQQVSETGHQCFKIWASCFNRQPSGSSRSSLYLSDSLFFFQIVWCLDAEYLKLTSEVEAIYLCRYLSYRSNVYIIYMFYPIYLTIDRSTYLCPSIFSIYLLIIDQSTYPSIYPNIYLSIYGINWYIHLSHLISSHLISSYLIYLCMYLSIYLSIYPSLAYLTFSYLRIYP